MMQTDYNSVHTLCYCSMRSSDYRAAPFDYFVIRAVGLKIETHEIHQNLRNPMCIINKKSTLFNKIHLYKANII